MDLSPRRRQLQPDVHPYLMPRTNPLGEFAEFLASDTYLHSLLFEDLPWEWHPGEPSSVFDAIAAWLYFGNAAEVCPTFEDFLITIIEIINAWSDNRTTVEGMPLAPSRLEPDPDKRDRVPGEIVENIGETGYEDWIHQPLMNASVFRQVQASRRAGMSQGTA